MLNNKKNKTKRLRKAIKEYIWPLRILIAAVFFVLIGLFTAVIFTDNQIVFYVTLGVAIVSVFAFYFLTNVYADKIADFSDKELISDISGALNALHSRSRRIEMQKTNIIEFDDMKRKLADAVNSFRDVRIVDRQINDSYLKFSYIDGYDNLITKESFIYNFPFFLKIYSYNRGGFILVKILGEDISQKPVKDMMACIRGIFSTKTFIGKYNDDTLGIYVCDVESSAVFKALCIKLFSEYSSMNVTISKTIVYSCKVGAAIYPYSDKSELFNDAESALRQDGDVNINIPSKINSNPDIIESEDESARKKAVLVSKLIHSVYDQSKDADASKSAEDILSFAKYCGFEVAGYLLKASSEEGEDVYKCEYESGEDSAVFLNGKDDIPISVIASLFMYRDENSCFFSSRREDLPQDVRTFFDHYGLQAFYCSFFGADQNNSGMTYFASRKKRQQGITNSDGQLIAQEMVAINYFIMVGIIKTINSSLRSVISDLLKLTDRMRYVVNPKSFALITVSDSMKSSFTMNKAGKNKCYKVLFGLDKPCENCPLLGAKNSLEPFNFMDSQYCRRVIAVDKKDESCSMLLTKLKEQTHEYELRYDLATYMSSRSSFDSLIASLVSEKSKGTMVFIVLQGLNQIVTDYGEANLNAILIEIKKRIYAAGLTDSIYRYADATLAIYWPNLVRTDAYEMVENIHKEIFKTYQVAGNVLQCNFKYFEINFTGNFADPGHVYDLIGKGSEQAKKLLDNYLCIAGEDISRMAGRSEYILYLMEENYLNKAVEFRIQPIVDMKTGKIQFGEILLRLYDAMREKMLPPMEIVQTATIAKKMGQFDSLNFVNALSLFNKYGPSAFRIYAYGGFTINVSSDSLNSNEWLSNLKHFIENNSMPDNFISVELDESDINKNLGRTKVWLNDLKGYHIYMYVDNYSEEFFSPKDLAEMGFNGIKIARSLLIGSTSDSVTNGLFRSIIMESHSNNLRVVAQGAETQAHVDFAKASGADYCQGYFLGNPMKIDEFILALEDNAKKLEENRIKDPSGGESKKTLSAREIKKQKKNDKKALKLAAKANKMAQTLQETVSASNDTLAN